MPEAVIFDMDGVLVDSEEAWDGARRQLTEESGGRWRQDAQRAMMGMSSVEWSHYMRDELGVPKSPEEISEEVAERLARLYRERLPLIAGADSAVRGLAAGWPLGLASSANRSVIELALELAGLSDDFVASVSSEEVARGKPAPDVYLEAAARLEIEPERCAAVEDSSSGLRAATAAGMAVIAIPNRTFPPDRGAVERADVVLDSLDELTPEVVEKLA